MLSMLFSVRFWIALSLISIGVISTGPLVILLMLFLIGLMAM